MKKKKVHSKPARSSRKPAARSSKKAVTRAKPARRISAKPSPKRPVAPRPRTPIAAAKGKANGKVAVPAKGGTSAAKGGPNGKVVKLAAVKKGPAPAAKRQRVRVCKQENCTNPQTTQGFCRLHYLLNWKTLREEKEKRAQKNLDRYVERMAGTKKPASGEEAEEAAEGTQKSEEAVFEEDFGEFVDVLSREENLDKILNGIKVEDY